MVDVSIIMPVYNSEKYLEDAIESILAQTYLNFELILVDDGSTDNSAQICNQYMNKDKRVKVIHQKNMGISGARNTGLSNSIGEYIVFADNDDRFLPTLLEDNIKLIKEENADVVKFSVRYLKIDDTFTTEEVYKYHLSDGVYDKGYLISNYDALRRRGVFTFVWNMIVKKSLIQKNNIIFDERIKFGGEDNKFNYELFKNVNKLVCNSKAYYIHYRRVSHSTVVKFNINKAESSILIVDAEKSIVDSLGIDKSIWYKYLVEYISFIVNIIFDNRNTMSFRERVNYLEEVKRLNQFNIDINTKEILRIECSTKYNITTLLMLQGKYRLLDYLLRSYKKIRRQQ
ncbi:Glycosyltransferase involved in cell wall bisynthesis [Clostridium collagenovorans DSM 3089]|uniref:Glycosyltransferase involved in cell wall bisynthesis n=1 Tax=Clostridium collagenovorans DSM 3089 TaxID=1121306 RepID=A0A1M5X348_9CLOT|nr:glycosyltransferase family 2 protein [Clostridium collagenovorans]SHH94265.1 Glycosyltransferase involved in cell wall bisynthesis [Clostridium collagenovorans DSM 3089]